MKLAVFAYNFPHKKTQDFLLRLFLENYDITFVIACEPERLNLPKTTYRVKPRYMDMIHPSAICQRLNVPYRVLPHNSTEVAEMLRANGIEVGIISGARILQKHIIQSVKKGIINFHPGLIPEVRGLDALKWAIYHDLPIGVTAHFIDERVDAGRIILKQEIPIYKDDTIIDLSFRLDESQVKILTKVLESVKDRVIAEFPLASREGKANSQMPSELEKQLPQKLREKLSKL
ncbi:formyltransferase family protein [Chloroflexota bacterium]